MARNKTIHITCWDCHVCWVLTADICEMVIHPDEHTYLSWSCPNCGPQSRRLTSHNIVAWLDCIGVPIADWSHIIPEDPGWPLWTVDEIIAAQRIGRTAWKKGGAMDKELRRLLEEAGA